MTSNLDYCFISAPPGVVRRAWKKWSGGRVNGAYFVPAQGGCFLVQLKAAVSAGPIAWLQSHAAAALKQEPQVEQFRAAFENGHVR